MVSNIVLESINFLFVLSFKSSVSDIFNISRTATLDLPVCLNNGNKHHLDVTFRNQHRAGPQTGSYILIDSVRSQPIQIIENYEIENC